MRKKSARRPRRTREAAIDSQTPVRVTAARGFTIGRGPATPASPRRGAAAGAAPTSDSAALLAALADQELFVADEFTIAPTGNTSVRPSARSGVAATPSVPAASVDVEVSPVESAVVLVDQDGDFTWHFPEPVSTKTRAGARRSSSTTSRAPSKVTIRVRLKATRTSSPSRKGLGVGSVVSAARGIVLKFVARAATGVAMKFLERNVRRGLIVMEGDDATQWRRIGNINELTLPKNDAARILLWVHGTFSSTQGSFGALTTTDSGRELLRRAREQYDAVIGFDHLTLAEDPHENAVDLVERLGRFERPMKIDAITYSRGGLVFRSMVEELIPASQHRPELGSAVFVAVPNAGTLLAEPQNWRTLIDLYTNLAMGAFRLLQLVPAAAPSARILSETISGLGAFVKYLADVVVTERRVPGLAAMEPNGNFVRALNRSTAGEPTPTTSRYMAITSNFEPRAVTDGGQRTGLATSFLGRLANGLVDRLMREPNDLVVNDASMKRIDADAGTFIDAALDFGDSATVYHTVYFAQKRVADQLREWLLEDATRRGLSEFRGRLTVRPSPHSPFERVAYREPVAAERAAAPVAMAAVGTAETARRGAGKRRGLASVRAGSGAREAAEAPLWPASMGVEDVAQQYLTVFGAIPDTGLAGKVPGKRRGIGRTPASEGIRAFSGVARDSSPRAAGGAASLPGRRGLSVAGVEERSDVSSSPTLVHKRTQLSSLSDEAHVHVVSFSQTHDDIPIFGSNAVVELDDAKRLVSAHAKLARIQDVSRSPALSPSAAFGHLLGFIDKKAGDVAKAAQVHEKASLNFFHDTGSGRWHLVYVFRDIPALPATWQRPGDRGRSLKHAIRDGHGIGPSPRQRFPRLDYLVDANDGTVVYYYSVTPTAAKRGRRGVVKSPVKAIGGFVSGFDDEGRKQRFEGSAFAHGFQLVDPQRRIRTVDFNGGDIDAEPIKLPGAVTSATFDFGTNTPAAVSAHVNASHVFQFFNDVLIRRGVDDQGTELVNVVNCTATKSENPPNWNNAVWWNGKMWYGRQLESAKGKNGKFLSYARYLDIIAHELTHGVTETTSDLVYRDQAGALNESFSDIFGVIINNWVRKGADTDPRTWDWIIGQGLGEKPNAPLRSMKDPTITGDPDHMKDYRALDPDDDFGGVHTNSNIHNKAAYNLLTRTRGKAIVIPPREVAKLYYFTLQRLDRVATFRDVLETMLDVAKTMYPDPAEATPKSEAIRGAYADVGIGSEMPPAAAPTPKKRTPAKKAVAKRIPKRRPPKGAATTRRKHSR